MQPGRLTYHPLPCACRSESRSSADYQPQLALLSGWVYRESGVVSGISNQRWGSLFSHSFVTFRKEASREPSKVWPLHGHCKLSSVERKEVMVRNRHTSTIWALAAGHYEKKQLVSLQRLEQRDIGRLSPCCGAVQTAAAGGLKPALFI